jgi:hypothetical protein
LFLPESYSGHRPPRAFSDVTVAYACGPSLMLLLVGQAVPFLGHLEECGALLSGWEVSSHEMELTRKPPILFRFARHSGPLASSAANAVSEISFLVVQKMHSCPKNDGVVGGNSPPLPSQ